MSHYKRRFIYSYDENCVPAPGLYVHPVGSPQHRQVANPVASYWNSNKMSKQFRTLKSITLMPDVKGSNYFES